jgi:hypothetical protein
MEETEVNYLESGAHVIKALVHTRSSVQAPNARKLSVNLKI